MESETQQKLLLPNSKKFSIRIGIKYINNLSFEII